VASDIFAKIGGIIGESLGDKHNNEIEVASWSWRLQRERRHHAWHG